MGTGGYAAGVVWPACGPNNPAMKFFWSLILGLVLLTAALFALQPGSGSGTNPDSGVGAGSAARGGTGMVAATTEPLRPTAVLPERRESATDAPNPTASSSAAAPSNQPPTFQTTGIDHRHTHDLPDHPAFALVRVSDPATVSDWLDDLLDVDYTPTVTVREPSTETDTALVDAPPLPSGPPVPANFDPNDPNLLAGRFPLRGSGTKADPFRLPWEAFVAVRETYRPRTGHNDLPEWLDRIDGKYIALTGYLMLPLVQEATDEVLLMRNQWDGCCIGVPPTPYDGIEVKLNKPMAGQSSWRMNYGTITGKLAVDPYIVSGWLIGLYLLDDAALVDSGL